MGKLWSLFCIFHRHVIRFLPLLRLAVLSFNNIGIFIGWYLVIRVRIWSILSKRFIVILLLLIRRSQRIFILGYVLCNKTCIFNMNGWNLQSTLLHSELRERNHFDIIVSRWESSLGRHSKSTPMQMHVTLKIIYVVSRWNYILGRSCFRPKLSERQIVEGGSWRSVCSLLCALRGF